MEVTQMANSHMKKEKISVISHKGNVEIQIMRYCYPFTRMAKICKSENTKFGDIFEHLELSYIVGAWSSTTIFRKGVANFCKTKHKHVLWPSTSRYLLKRNKGIWAFIIILFIKAPNWKQFKCLLTQEQKTCGYNEMDYINSLNESPRFLWIEGFWPFSPCLFHKIIGY